MRISLDKARGDLMRAFGDYHSHTQARNWEYQLRVLNAALLLFDRRP